jgi:hypothetical protein
VSGIISSCSTDQCTRDFWNIPSHWYGFLKEILAYILGYREFVPVVEAGPEVNAMDLRQKAIKQMRLHTRQYVNRQLAWINNKLIPLCAQQNGRTPIFILDATDPTQWHSKVLAPAISISKGIIPS